MLQQKSSYEVHIQELILYWIKEDNVCYRIFDTVPCQQIQYLPLPKLISTIKQAKSHIASTTITEVCLFENVIYSLAGWYC